MRELGCEIERKSEGEIQAFFQCQHGIWAFSDKTEDCHCQTPIYKNNLQNGSSGASRNNRNSQTVASAASEARLNSSKEKKLKTTEREKTIFSTNNLCLGNMDKNKNSDSNS